MHDHPSPISVLSLPYPPIQWFFLVFRTCYHHPGSFSQLLGGSSAARPMTRSATLGRAFSLDEAFSGTIDMPYVLYMLLLHISMLSFTFILRVAAAVSILVRRTRPTSTGFRHEYWLFCSARTLHATRVPTGRPHSAPMSRKEMHATDDGGSNFTSAVTAVFSDCRRNVDPKC